PLPSDRALSGRPAQPRRPRRGRRTPGKAPPTLLFASLSAPIGEAAPAHLDVASLRTGGTRGEPALDRTIELLMSDRRRCARPTVMIGPGCPRPVDERIVGEMIGERCGVALAVSRGVEDRSANLAVGQTFPCHRERRKVPAWRSRHTACRIVLVLMAGAAMEAGCTGIRWAPHHVEEMAMAVIA